MGADLALNLQLLASGLAIGSIYGLIAFGVNLIYRAVAVVNFAIGELVMLGAYFGSLLALSLGLPVPLAILMALVASVGVGLVLERTTYTPLRNADIHMVVVATIGASIFLQEFARIIWGAQVRQFPAVFDVKSVDVGDIHLAPQYLVILTVTALLLVGLYLFFQRTVAGKIMEAVAQDKDTAALMGIQVSRWTSVTFGLHGLLAGIGGILLAPLFFVFPSMGFLVGMKGFCAAMIGGFGNMQGAVIGGLLVGLAETFGAYYVASDYQDGFAFVAVVAVLALRPQGIFGEPVAEKV